jgi:putative ATP-binding cassette transporter
VPILALFARELADGRWRWFLIMAAISGLAGATVLAVINLAAASIDDRDGMVQLLILLVLAIVIYVYAQKTLMIKAAELAQNTVHQLRIRLLQTVEAAELVEVEHLNRNEMFACINSEMRAISDGASTLMIIAQAAVLAFVTMLYLAWLSLFAFVLAVAVIGIAASIHLARARQVAEQHARLFDLNTEMMDGFGDLIDGFKETKLNTAGAEELVDVVRRRSTDLANQSIAMHTLFATSFVASQVTFYVLTGMMVFVVPMFVTIDSATLVKITATTLFVIGPISNVVSGLPTIQRLNAAAQSILSLQSRLSEIQLWSPENAAAITSFERIGLAGATFQYGGSAEEQGFTIGPVDLEIRRGQAIFITGGNGSGKSTLLKLITGLYLPTTGALTLDGKAVEKDRVVAYRNLFAATFSDYHLFKELYGIPNIDPARIDEYTKLMELESKVTIAARAFSTVALSTGQRKRLAMIVALLSSRPIYIFDEWAADQDPHFRQKFYHSILPDLKSSGKTVIAVTHDERYFAAADVRYHMEEGRFRRASDLDPPATMV